MITLCGFAVSNYYNKVKLALIEKNVPFTEELVMTKSTDPAVLVASPLGKIPYIRTPQGSLCESQAIMEYIEAAFPQPALMPSDPYAAGKVRELITYIELHLELVVRDLYAQAFFGGTVSDSTKERVRKQLDKNIPAFKQLVHFSPFIAGSMFTQADCSAYVSLPLVGMASKVVYGEDLLAAHGVDYKPYLKTIGERASAQKVDADRKLAARKTS
jgi:glutathione S-transferase